MKALIYIIFVLVFSIPFLDAQTYELDHKESDLLWTGKAAFSAYTLSGTIDPLGGQLTISDDGEITEGSVSIDMKSLDADNSELKKHLRSADFFHVKKYKEARFELESMTQGNDCCEGLMTLKEITKPFSGKVDININEDMVIIKGLIIIDRTDYGITFNSPTYFEKLKDQAIDDVFEVELRLVFKRR